MPDGPCVPGAAKGGSGWSHSYHPLLCTPCQPGWVDWTPELLRMATQNLGQGPGPALMSVFCHRHRTAASQCRSGGFLEQLEGMGAGSRGGERRSLWPVFSYQGLQKAL